MATSAGTVERGSRARAALALLPAARAPQFPALVRAQVPAEVQHPIQDVVGLEVGLAAVEMHEPSRNEAPLFVEHEPDAPAPARARRRRSAGGAGARGSRAPRARGSPGRARSPAFPRGPEAAVRAACRTRTPDGTT